MVKRKVIKAAAMKELPAGAKIMSSTWAIKNNSNGKYRARLNERGYEQIDGVHYDSTSISSPVTNTEKVRSMVVLSLIFGWCAELIDFQGAFICGNFKNEEKILMGVPEGFEQ
jgi:hypothetical protein